MKIELCDVRRGIIAALGHVVVLGGPGSGKTTIALLKAKDRIASLKPGQEVLFLSFSRAAVRQILLRCRDLLSGGQRKLIQVRTYHAFCLEILQAHGRLLRGCPVRIIHPGEERLRQSTFEGDWPQEQQRLAGSESVCCFDQFAAQVASLLERSVSVRRLMADKYPLVILDEFQDTDNGQWRMMKSWASTGTIFCLADPDQRIFDYRPDVDPKRLEVLRAELQPAVFDLRGENHRSPAAGILKLANAVLHDQGPLPPTGDVRALVYYPKNFAASVHMGVVRTFAALRSLGNSEPCVAVLARTNGLVAQVSAILAENHSYKGAVLAPLHHDVVWDAELTAAAALVVASILEWHGTDPDRAMAATFTALSQYFRMKNAESPSKSAAAASNKFATMATNAAAGKPNRGIGKTWPAVAARGVGLVGEPLADWKSARGVLEGLAPVAEVLRDVKLVRLFHASDALARGLRDTWIARGDYRGAVGVVKAILDRERLMSAERDPRGCVLMNMYKSKGKEFDGVVLVEGSFSGRFFDVAREAPPYAHSRRLLRVALTRARSFVTLVRPHDALPLAQNGGATRRRSVTVPESP